MWLRDRPITVVEWVVVVVVFCVAAGFGLSRIYSRALCVREWLKN